MSQKGTYEYIIEQRDVDFTGKVSYTSMMNYILQAAGDDADVNGFGISDLNCDNCSWVLSRLCVEFLRRPVNSEPFAVRTWVNEVNKLMTTRNMSVTDNEGKVIANAVTQWAMIDLEKRSAVDIREHLDYASAVSDEPSPIELPKRVGRVEPSVEVSHKVVYSDIDFNRHVNAMKYLEWMIDIAPFRYMTEKQLQRLDVNFLHEARYGEILTIKFQEKEKFQFEVVNESGLPNCKVMFTWN